MPSETRVRRVAERIHNTLAELLHREVSDPRLEMITVTAVELDREMAYATVYVSAIEAEERRQEVMTALEKARGYFRSELAQRIHLRSFPQLRFRWDSSPEHGARIEALLKSLREEREGDKGALGEG